MLKLVKEYPANTPIDIDWSKQHCGVHRASWSGLIEHMPDVAKLVNKTFPESFGDFTWDVKVHMLMPGQYPCIPNWHYDNVPRIDNAQDFSKVSLDKYMYLWVSNNPLTEFKDENGEIYPITPKIWHRFTQKDIHRGTISHDFQWRGFIRATHKDILSPKENCLRRHSQVYLDAQSFRW